MKQLSHVKADIEAKDNNGFTPLHLASENGSLVCVKHLLELGADWTVKNASQKTPLQLASHNGHLEVQGILKSQN